MKGKRFLGVTVLPEYIQSEGVGGVLDNLVEKVGANAVATSPYLMEEADHKTGNREPPVDAGAGAVRLLDRPLFGKRIKVAHRAARYGLWINRYAYLSDKKLDVIGEITGKKAANS